MATRRFMTQNKSGGVDQANKPTLLKSWTCKAFGKLCALLSEDAGSDGKATLRRIKARTHEGRQRLFYDLSKATCDGFALLGSSRNPASLLLKGPIPID